MEKLDFVLFFAIVLNGLISHEKMANWHTFVKGCLLLTRPVITKRQALLADMLFVKFGKEFEEIYGRKSVTPNMHFACHMYECVEQFGPVSSFWLFAFERYNGFLGKFSSNGRDVEKCIYCLLFL